MGRRGSRAAEVLHEQVLTPEQETCPSCGQRLWVAYTKQVIRHIQDLPNLSAEALAQQLEEFYRALPQTAPPVSSEEADES